MMKNGEVTLLVGKYYEKLLHGGDETVRKNDYFGSERATMRENHALSWLLTDQQGSTVATANENGTLQSEMRYSAFGETRTTSGTTPTDYLYTGQREEAEVGLYYYGARFYDPALGRFIQADTLIPEPGSPQSWGSTPM